MLDIAGLSATITGIVHKAFGPGQVANRELALSQLNCRNPVHHPGALNRMVFHEIDHTVRVEIDFHRFGSSVVRLSI